MSETQVSPYAHGISTLFGLLLFSNGVKAILSPRAYCDEFGLPLESNQNHQGPSPAKANHWIPLTGIRNVAIASMILVMSYQSNFQGLGTLFLFGSMVPAADGYYAYVYGRKSGVWRHVFGTVINSALGGYLLWKA